MLPKDYTTDVSSVSSSEATSLTETHQEQLIAGSGLSQEVIAARGYYSISGADGYATLKRLGFKPGRSQNCDGLILPLHSTDGQQSLSIPTVCLYVTSWAASSYGYDDDKSGPTRCALIGAARGDRSRLTLPISEFG